MELKTANRITDVSPSEWNSVVDASNDTIFQSYQWLRAYENGHPELEPYHILIYDGSELVAACPMYLERRDAWLEKYGDVQSVLLSHSFQAWYSNILGRPDDEMIITVVLDMIEEIAAACDADAFGFGAIRQRESALMESLKSNGYTVVQHNCTMILDVPSSIESYLDSLDGGHRRDFRRRVRRAREKGVTAEAVDDMDFDLFQSLCYEIFKKHDDYDKRFSTDFLRAIETHLDDEITYMAVTSPDNEIISAFQMLESGDCLYPWIGGIDYEYLKPYDPSIFFYYVVVEYAIEQGISQIDIGPGVLEFKQKFGYEPRLTYLALKGQDVDLRLDEVFPKAEIDDGKEVTSCC